MVKINPRRDLRSSDNSSQNLGVVGKIFLLVLICSVFFLVHISSRTWVVQKSYKIGTLREKVSKLEGELATVLVEKNRVMGPRNLQSLVQKLETQGVVFKKPTSSQVVFMDSKEPFTFKAEN